MITQQIVQTSDTPNSGRSKWNTDIGRTIAQIAGGLGPNNDLKYDKDGVGSMMVFIPRFNWDPANGFNSTTIHPAFVVNGVEKPGFWVSKYQCVLIDSGENIIDTTFDPGHTHLYKARSLPGQKPRTYIDYDSAVRSCDNMNNGTTITGWHVLSNAEWAAIALFAQENATMPNGNNNYGRDIDKKHITGEIVSGDTFGSGTSRWKTGSGGPLTAHNQEESGIYDLSGNVWEWVSGFKLNEGKILVAGNLNASPTAIGNSFKAAEADYFDTGMYVNWDGAGSTISFSNISRGTTMEGASPDYKSMQFDDIPGANDDLKKLAIGPVAVGGNIHGEDHSYWRNFAERLPLRGGYWYNGTNAGVFMLHLYYARAYVYSHIGFRAAFIE